MYGVGWQSLDGVDWSDFVLMAAHIEGRRAAERKAQRDAERRSRA
jgi:hypothetical protein